MFFRHVWFFFFFFLCAIRSWKTQESDILRWYQDSCDLLPDLLIQVLTFMSLNHHSKNRYFLTCYSVITFYIKTLKRNTLWAHNVHPGIPLPASYPHGEELEIWVRDWAVSLFSSERFCALGRVSPFVNRIPALWGGGPGLAVWGLSCSEL